MLLLQRINENYERIKTKMNIPYLTYNKTNMKTIMRCCMAMPMFYFVG